MATRITYEQLREVMQSIDFSPTGETVRHLQKLEDAAKERRRAEQEALETLKAGGKNRAHRYRPAYFTGFEEESAEYSTLQELMALPFVASWQQEPNFKRYLIENDKHQSLVMADMGVDGCWVIALLDLPEMREQKPVLSLKKRGRDNGSA